jgi:hypothetical protein
MPGRQEGRSGMARCTTHGRRGRCGLGEREVVPVEDHAGWDGLVRLRLLHVGASMGPQREPTSGRGAARRTVAVAHGRGLCDIKRGARTGGGGDGQWRGCERCLSGQAAWNPTAATNGAHHRAARRALNLGKTQPGH